MTSWSLFCLLCPFFSLNKEVHFNVGDFGVCCRDAAKQNRLADRTNTDFHFSSQTSRHCKEGRRMVCQRPRLPKCHSIDAGSTKDNHDWLVLFSSCEDLILTSTKFCSHAVGKVSKSYRIWSEFQNKVVGFPYFRMEIFVGVYYWC